MTVVGIALPAVPELGHHVRTDAAAIVPFGAVSEETWRRPSTRSSAFAESARRWNSPMVGRWRTICGIDRNVFDASL
jgi:hypothetical protein